MPSFLQCSLSPLSFATLVSVCVVVATSSSLYDFPDVDVSSIRPLESCWYSFVLSSAPRRTSSEFFTSSRASCIDCSLPLNTLKVESLQISRHQQNLRHLLSTARRTGDFPICSSPFAEVAHENFGLVFLWGRSRCKLKDSDNIILELS